jgi:hypothetical protein
MCLMDLKVKGFGTFISMFFAFMHACMHACARARTHTHSHSFKDFLKLVHYTEVSNLTFKAVPELRRLVTDF